MSTVLSLAMVVAAGVIAWYGLRPDSSSDAAGTKEAVTLAGAQGASPRTVQPLELGGLATRVVVPSAGIDAGVSLVGVTVEDGRAAWETAWRSAGYHIDSARPGQPGNVVLTGHVSVASGANTPVFANLDRVREGDTIEVFSGETVYRYAVNRVMVVDPSSVNVLRSEPTATVTLITCTHDLRHRLVIVGTLISSTVQPLSG